MKGCRGDEELEFITAEELYKRKKARIKAFYKKEDDK